MRSLQPTRTPALLLRRQQTFDGGLLHWHFRWLAFMSDRSLTGYDNTDVSETETPTNPKVPSVKTKVHHDEEVYLYDAATSRLVCASCNPSGQRPEGVFDPEEEEPGYHKLLVDEPASWETHWLAGSVPGWTTFHISKALYQSRYLSNNGRLFFNSPDALVPADVDHQENVYEFEPEGVGNCQAGVADAGEVYEPATGACVALISSGTSGQESAFLDASATGGANSEGAEGGGDVFLLTTSPLAPQDLDQAYDIYDAHECTAVSPCATPSATASTPPCTTADSCRAAPTPQPSIYGAPSSATFSGPGNLAPPSPAVKPKVQTKGEKLAKVLKACKKDKKKKKRESCEKAARKAYGAKTSAKKSNTASRATNDRRGKS